MTKTEDKAVTYLKAQAEGKRKESDSCYDSGDIAGATIAMIEMIALQRVAKEMSDGAHQ